MLSRVAVETKPSQPKKVLWYSAWEALCCRKPGSSAVCQCFLNDELLMSTAQHHFPGVFILETSESLLGVGLNSRHRVQAIPPLPWSLGPSEERDN